ncbi:MAG: tetratricopeptide repeat protein [Rhodothermales bacterium]
MKNLVMYCGLLLVGLISMAAGCGGDPNVEGAKLALTLDDVNYEEYLSKLDQAIASNPQNAEAYEVKGKLLQRQAGEVRDAAQHTEIVEKMVEAYNKALEVEPGRASTIQQLRQAYVSEFQLGFQAFNRGRENKDAYTEAVTYFQNTSTIQPDSAGPYVNAAYAMINAGMQQQAIAPFEKALSLGENEADSYVLLSNLYMQHNRTPDAIALLEKARDMYPDKPELQSQLLNAYITSGQMDRAKQVYADAVKREPDNKLYHYNYGTLLLEAEEYAAAEAEFRSAIRLDPDYGVAYYNLGATFINQAVAVNEQISEKDDHLRENRDSMSSSQRTQAEEELEGLVEQRKQYFEQAVEPLEKARDLQVAAGEDATLTCNALFTAYVQTGQQDKAEEAAACAGIDLN